MKLCIWFSLFLLCCFSAAARDYPNCTNHYFKNKKISTSECYDADHRWGKAIAYNANGAVIYEKELRRIAGHSSVMFSYYENGGVKKAEWSSAPDGGIQWYSSVTTFSEDGTITSVSENDYDNKPSIIQQPAIKLPAVINPVAPRSDSSRTVIPVGTYNTEVWYTNNNRRAVIVTATRGPEQTRVTVDPKQTVKGAHFILARQFEDPSFYFQFTVTPKYKYDKARYALMPSHRKPEQVNKETRRYYFDVVKEK